jgi:hypothetical protein
MKATEVPIFSPTTPGPWGVDSIGKNWYVIHRDTLRCKCIGRIGAKGINYFDRAIAEANTRNLKGQQA